MSRQVRKEPDIVKEISNCQETWELFQYQPDQIFVVWFMYTRLGISVEIALTAIPQRSNDNNVDALFIDREKKRIQIIQGKFHSKDIRTHERQNDVLGLVNLGKALLSDDDEEFETHCSGISKDVHSRLRQARQMLAEQYEVELYFVTNARVSDAIKTKAANAVKGVAASIEIIDYSGVANLLQKYLDGSPLIGTINLKIEDGECLHRVDKATKIHSWVFAMEGRSVGELYAKHGDRLFALNIRGFEGEDKAVNQAMAKTLAKEPQYFWFYNNGITILCDAATETTESGGKSILSVTNPQIINGQQTTIMLSRAKAPAQASVSVRLIVIPSSHTGINGFDGLLPQIIRSTNSQTRVKAYQLMSNDRSQIAIERHFERIDYGYTRKKSKATSSNGTYTAKPKFTIEMDELAKAVAACELDPSINVRHGPDTLFEEHYDKLFPPNRDHRFYLPRFWISKIVAEALKNLPAKKRKAVTSAKWLAIHFIWQDLLSEMLRSKGKADYFRSQCEKSTQLKNQLIQVSTLILRSTEKFYRFKTTSGIEEHQGFRELLGRKGIYQDYLKFWNKRNNSDRTRYKQFVEKFSKLMQELK